MTALVKLVENLQIAGDLNDQHQRILEILEGNGREILGRHPEIFKEMIKKAPLLITSPHYLSMELTNTYMKLPQKQDEGPLQCLVSLVEKMDPDSKYDLLQNHQDNFLTLIQVLISAENSIEASTRCIRFLITHAQFTSCRNFLMWTDPFIDILEQLLVEGADPTWIPEGKPGIQHIMGDEGSVLFKFLIPLNAILTKNKQITHKTMKLLNTFFLTEKNLTHWEPHGTVLHALIRPALHNYCLSTISEVVKVKPDLIVTTDQNGCTALHIFVKKSYHSLPNFGLDVFHLLTTTANVNLCNNMLETPYSWVLTRKVQRENETLTGLNMYSEIDEFFISLGADGITARAGAAAPVYRWIVNELEPTKCTLESLQELLSYMKTVTNWHLCDSWTELQRNPLINSLMMPCHPKLIPIVLEIWQILMKNVNHARETCRQLILGEYTSVPSLVRLKILCLCMENGAKVTNMNLQEILSWTNPLTRKTQYARLFLRLLIAMQKKKLFRCDLTSLADLYIIPRDLLDLARQLVCIMYDTLESCFKSGNLIEHLLFISREENLRLLNDGSMPIFGDSSNWLRRSPLHLAVIFLDTEDALDHLPKRLFKDYINAKDIHGCTPLHVAYLHHNDIAANFLLSHDADEGIADEFGMCPKSLWLRPTFVSKDGLLETVYYGENKVEHPDVEYHKLCCSVIDRKSGVLDQLKPMLIIAKEEAENLCEEIKTLFGRLVKETKLKEFQIVITGSLREKLKIGRLDEIDVQIRFTSSSIDTDDSKQFLKELSYNMMNNLSEISWDGINLRPISAKGPWKFIREGCSKAASVTLSVDVVPLIVFDEDDDQDESEKYDGRHHVILQHDLYRLQQEILEGSAIHRGMEFSTLDTWKDTTDFYSTKFAYEWDIIDSLPPSCRLAIVISKALVEAYDWCHGDKVNVEMPISSYTIKTALFYIIAYHSGPLEFAQNSELQKEDIRVLKEALETVLGKFDSFKTKHEKLKFHPNPKWTTDEDLDQHGEEARLWAWKIFALINCLAKHRRKLKSFWDRFDIFFPLIHLNNFGEAEYVWDICDCLLGLLDEKRFWG